MKRVIDIIFSLAGIVLLSPVLLLLSVFVYASSRGHVLYRQIRVGKDEKPFTLLKFRTMLSGADRHGPLSLGDKDPRIYRGGHWLRRYKLDELPQLFNVLRGDMSLVGPRPEVPHYVAMYSPRQREVLKIRPGLTDYASIHFFDEGNLLAGSADPEKTYIEEILPRKLELSLMYVREAGFLTDTKIIWLTFRRIIH